MTMKGRGWTTAYRVAALSSALTYGLATEAVAELFQWPVDDSNVTQYYDQAGSGHGGIDLTGDPTIRAAAHGFARTIPNGTYNLTNHCMGNVVVIDHNSGKGPFSLYAHLSRIDILDGQEVSPRDPIGLMGNTGTWVTGSSCSVINTHLHFEIKTRDAMGNLGDDGPEWSYPDENPNLYGYTNPYPFFEYDITIFADTIAVVSTSAQAVRTGPDPSYTRVVASVERDQIYGATAHYNGWYLITFPSDDGPANGWIEASYTESDLIELLEDEVRVRTAPSTSTGVRVAYAWHKQWFPVLGAAASGGGCGAPWYEVELADNAGGGTGWICGDYVELHSECPDFTCCLNSSGSWSSESSCIGNTPPDRPTNVSPTDGATVATLTPTLQCSSFSDPDGDAHEASWWEVRSCSDPNDRWDSGWRTYDLTSTEVPSGELQWDGCYQWKCRYADDGAEIDEHLPWSEPAPIATTFYTTQCECASVSACCDGCDYKASTTVCQVDADAEYACPWGTDCGDNVGIRYRDRLCSGTSSSCNGGYGAYRDWQTADNCTSAETCAPGDSSCNDSSSCDCECAEVTACCDGCNYESSTTVCRVAAGVCDMQEYCTGAGAFCPADTFVSSTTICRGSGGVCDVAETCSGSTATCPGNQFASTSAVCRASTGVCDAVETCTGTSASCPANSVAPSSTVCREVGGACDVAEDCTGSSDSCPADAKQPDGSSCDDDVYCNGDDSCSSGECTVHAGDPCSGQACNEGQRSCGCVGEDPCRASVGPCDTVEYCSDGGCPADTLAPSATLCRTAAGVCDVPEYCTGTAASCPSDSFASSSTECRSASAVCDAAEYCTGSGPLCSIDDFASVSVVCRASTDVCDPAENCSGTEKACPADAFSENGSVCDDGNACTVSETCSNGSCVAGGHLDCSDLNPCTDEMCDPSLGCVKVNRTGECSDGNPCDGLETCISGSCTGGPPPTCDDGDRCTLDECSTTDGCYHLDIENCATTRCSVSIAASGAESFGALQIWLDYSEGTGAFEGAVPCEPGVQSLFFAQNNDFPQRTLILGWVFDEPADLSELTLVARCDYAAVARLPEIEDFFVGIKDATDPDGSPIEVGAQISIDCESFCGNGIRENGEDCDGEPGCCTAECKTSVAGTPCIDDGNACTLDQCDGLSVACQHLPGNAGTLCRPSLGICDEPENCSGSDASCPEDAYRGTSTICRDSSGPCDVAETCTGTSATCPSDAVAESSTLCRPAAGICDVAESCTGSSVTCPADAVAASTITCRTSSGECDLAESCTGGSKACPTNVFVASNTTCSTDNNVCTHDVCNGAGSCTHPANSAACSDGLFCNGADTCSGGACTIHAGDPCSGPDSDADCAESCSETADSCSGHDPDMSACNDGDACTTNDLCTGGTCAGSSGESCVTTTTIASDPCGDPTGDGKISASDALFALGAAVGSRSCPVWNCDLNGDGKVLSSDALAILRFAVGQEVSLQCPDSELLSAPSTSPAPVPPLATSTTLSFDP